MCCALMLAALAPTGISYAQATTIVIAPRGSFADTLADRLRAGLEGSNANVELRVDDTSVGCDPIATHDATTEAETSVAVLVGDDATIAICTRAREAFTRRTAGPFAALDATAVEQIATMVEASLEALATPPPSADPAGQAETASPTNASAPVEAPPSNPSADNAPMPAQVSDATSTTHAAATSRPLPTTTRDDDAADPTTDASAPTSRSPIALTLAAGPTLWDAKSFALDGQLGARYGIGRWLSAALALTYGLPFERTISGLGARFSIVAIDALIVFAVPVSGEVMIDLALGPRAQWLLVRPFVVAASNATAGKDSYAFNLSGVLEATPRVQVARHLWLTATLGVVFASDPRAYGVSRGDAFEVILDQSIPRPYLRLGALLAL